MSDEPEFELYDKTRDVVPDTVEEAWENEGWDDDVEPDKVIVGWDSVAEVLDSETVHTNIQRTNARGQTAFETIEVSKYFWTEVDVRTAPTVSICNECDATVQSRSDEYIEQQRPSHHISSGH